MANKKYLQINASGVPQEDNVNIVLTTELSATTGAALVGVDDTTLTNATGADLQTILEGLDSAISGAGSVDSVNGQTGVVVLSADDLAADHTAVNYTPTNANIDGHLAGIDNKLASVQSPFNYKGAFDASAGDFTAISPAEVGDWYKVTVAGTISAVDFQVGDNILVNKDVAGTVVIADVDKIDNTDQVASVNGQQGVVVLDGADLDTTATINSATPAGTTIDDALEALDSAILANAKDDVIKGFLAASAINAGDPVYKSSATQVAPAEADSDTALEVIGVAAATVTAGNPVDVLKWGPSGAIYSGLTAGQPVYLSEAAGVTQTAPTTSGSYVLRIGKATAADAIDIETKNVAIQRA